MPYPRLKRALLAFLVLALAPCLFLTLLQPAIAHPFLSSTAPDQLKRIVQRAVSHQQQQQQQQQQHPFPVSDDHAPPTRKRATSLTIASFNIRYSNDANYDSARAPLQRIKRAITGRKQSQQHVDEAVPALPHQTPLVARGANPALRQKYWGERSWFLRGPRIADTVLFHNWDLFAMQEVLDAPYSNLRQWIGDDYQTVGVGRDDGRRAGEAVPLWWKRDVLELVPESQGGVGPKGYEHFWLSPTPEKVGSVGWDAGLTRMCTHVALRIRDTGELVHVFSTHYDNAGVVARSESSKLILRRAQQAADKTKQWQRRHHPAGSDKADDVAEPLVILVGDLNSPRNEGSWTSLVGGHYSVPKDQTGSTGPSFLDTALSVPTLHTSPYLTIDESPRDAQLASGSVAPQPFTTNITSSERGRLSVPYGPLRTFTDFEPSDRTAVEDRLDFIMLLDNGAVVDQTRDDAVLEGTKKRSDGGGKTEGGRWRIRSHGVVSSWSETDAGFLISDHRPVVTRIESRA
ncbi:uncharacterized protein PFL1_03484 [Pseudozyma flocculosa PF-1]|uniref:Endonuclease/exonuclease/phosphatase domain-containing protein n=2 Tax=Pseudozyma flocculosa TaxID=84751 RepID=A0A5C3FAR4_9BASI|nr:uncharacterized protein PFL1_03484 [Pseudozyma flocculosa PF-1]EPQ29197.1 hypothetical protein PFL1_03484 [Pseudozyma flocculosa PF-1]SPO41502.1 uncharacterized protein PSFLO_06984 [Pseudozyma flocculosa]